jgi:hypothetical protein
VPSDLKSGGDPKVESWGTPVAAWGNSTCDIATFFKEQILTFVRSLLYLTYLAVECDEC